MNRLWKPIVSKWLQKARTFQYRGLKLLVTPGVFHPGFFYSSKLLAGFVSSLPLQGKTFLDLGCGSGLVGLVAARKGARVTAVDIHHGAVACTRANFATNGFMGNVVQSDLFSSLASQAFDIIAVNPPYYSKAASTDEERAWNAGEQLDYFKSFFSQLRSVVHDHSEVYVILSEDCDLPTITAMAVSQKMNLEVVQTHRRFGEMLLLYRVSIEKI